MFGGLFQKFENHVLASEVREALQDSQQILTRLHAFDQQYQQDPQRFGDPESQQVLVRMKAQVADLSQAQDALHNGQIALEDHAAIREAIARIHSDVRSLDADLQALQSRHGLEAAPAGAPSGSGSGQVSGGGSGLFGDLLLMSALGVGG